MLRSMFSAVSGLQANQTFMDVVGNNIANINTTGFKANTVEFEDLLSQTLNGASAPNASLAGGTNPAQIGLGVRVAGIGTNFAQGAAEETGNSTDFAIQGDGFFVVNNGGAQEYTRDGSFSLDGAGHLVTADGGIVQGWQADTKGNVNSNASVGPISIPVGQSIAPVTTSNISIGGNLPSDSAVGTTINVSIDANNSLGASVPLTMTFTKVADTPGSTNWTVTTNDSANTAIAGPTSVQFDDSGNLTSGNITLTQAQLNAIPGTSGTWGAGGIALNFGAATDPDRLTGSATLNSVAALSQDGSAIGSLSSFSIGANGTISGVFSNGQTQSLGQIALATFADPSGLLNSGNSNFTPSANSGVPQIGVAGSGGRGTLSGGELEASNVDLGQEFTNMIIAQRGFEANAKVITTSDQLLQDLVNLKQT
jgi:flagellar hook protein FlgE